MQTITHQPYKIIWGIIPIIVILSLINLKGTIDIQLHDTYFVIAFIHLSFFLSAILIITGLLYWLVRRKKLISWMTLAHVLSTILLFLSIIITGFVFEQFLTPNHNLLRPLIVLSLLVFIISYSIFIINLTISLSRNDQPKNTL